MRTMDFLCLEVASALRSSVDTSQEHVPVANTLDKMQSGHRYEMQRPRRCPL